MKKISLSIIVIIIILLGVFYFAGKSHAPEALDIDNDQASDMEVQKEGLSFKISSEESSVEFYIDEVLRGKDFTVVGVTSEISGEIVLNKNDDGTFDMHVGEVLVDARNFKTDSENRDKAISGFILDSKNNEDFAFIKFSPIASEISLEDGVLKEVEVSGDLKVKDIVMPVIFSGKVMAKEGELSGELSATLLRSDFGLKIPSVPFVASVEDAFIVKAKIVAK